MGVGFILVSFGAFFFGPAGRIWWFWLLIPAFAMLGKGIAEIVSARYGPNLTHGVERQGAVQPTARAGELPPRNDVFFTPPSVTEQTTRHLIRLRTHIRAETQILNNDRTGSDPRFHETSRGYRSPMTDIEKHSEPV